MTAQRARGVLLAVLSLVLPMALPARATSENGVAFSLVTIASEDVALRTAIYRPVGDGPFPAVIALHGCGGLFNRVGHPSARHADWGERLAAQGFLVAMPDSFQSRGLGSQCAVTGRQVRPGRERVADLMAVRNWLLSLPEVKPDAISLLGWSNGGSTVLAAVRRDRKPADGKPDFARAVAFYPGCRVQAETRSFSARLPLLILIGEADDWTPAAPCVTLARLASGQGDAVDIKTYPDAFHDFDHPDRVLTMRSGLAFTASGSGRATTGTNRAARDDALIRVPAFLQR